MDIRDAITHARQVADGCAADNRDCAYQHDQLVGWLEELMAYRAAMPLERAKELAQAEQDGRLVVLPEVPEDDRKTFDVEPVRPSRWTPEDVETARAVRKLHPGLKYLVRTWQRGELFAAKSLAPSNFLVAEPISSKFLPGLSRGDAVLIDDILAEGGGRHL